MMTVMLYGNLGKLFGKVHRLEIKTASEAVRALSANFKGFKEEILNGSFRILRGGKEELNTESIYSPQSERETIRIIPVVQGAGGGGGLGNIILGAVLILAAPATGGMSLMAAFEAGAWGAVAGNLMVSMGMSLVLGGVASMLFSPSKNGTSQTSVERPDNKPSYAFDGAVNTVAQGNPVPICYGRLIVGSQVISAGLVSEQLSGTGHVLSGQDIVNVLLP